MSNVAQDIERSDYLERRRSLMSDKKSIEEQIARLSRTPTMWIEPMRNWIKDAEILDGIAKGADLPSKKLSLQKIFGLNLYLKSRHAFGNPFKHYASLREARQNFANNDISLIVARSTGLEPATSSVHLSNIFIKAWTISSPYPRLSVVRCFGI